MTQETRAIFENGLFRLLDPVSLAEHDLVSLVIGPAITPSSSSTPATNQQQKSLLAALAEAANLPLEGSNDDFSGADHDLVLYGWNK